MNPNQKGSGSTIAQAQGEEMRITREERELIRRTFAGKPELLKLMRKIFYPGYDAGAPLGQTVDLFTMESIDEMSNEQIAVWAKSKVFLGKHLERQLISLRLIAESKEEDIEEAKSIRAKNSTR